VNGNGIEVTQLPQIKLACEQYYTGLFSSVPTDPDCQTQFLRHLPRLPDNISSSLEDPISVEELFAALKSMKNNKSPGADGLSKEFYMAVFPVIKQQLLEVVNYICSRCRDESAGPGGRSGRS
jgi:hypothetical protein